MDQTGALILGICIIIALIIAFIVLFVINSKTKAPVDLSDCDIDESKCAACNVTSCAYHKKDKEKED